MAQVPVGFSEILFSRGSSSDGRGALVIGVDGFPWWDGGVVGSAQQRFDWLERARCTAAHAEADLVVSTTRRWLSSLDPVERVRAGLAWIARWHWLWNAGALEEVASDDDSLAELVFLMDDDMTEIVESSLWWTSGQGLPVEVLETMVRWSASALFDRAMLWPRSAVVRHLRQSIEAGWSVSAGLVEALELLRDAELREASLTRGEPSNQAVAIGALLDRMTPNRDPHDSLSEDHHTAGVPTISSILRVIEAIDGHETLTADEWASVLLDPRIMRLAELRRCLLAHLVRHALLDRPEIRAALAGARASALASSSSSTELLDELRTALWRPN